MMWLSLAGKMTAPKTADRVGQTLGNHRILSLLGQGGMGAVFLAEHTVLGRRAAIKVLLPELSHNEELVQRFFLEARSTAQLRHPAFVEVFDSGTMPDGSAYLVMEYLAGETLGECLNRRQRLPVAEALTIARDIAEGVGHAHRHGIVHRDLKPDNVFLAGEGGATPKIKVLDFGIAKLTAGREGGASQTRTGVILGTPLFMAPEQCRGAGKVVLDQRVDVYALGCILHMMLSGQPPFPLDGFGDIIMAHLSTPPPPLRSLEPAVPEPVEALVLRMLAKKPEDRPQTMDAVATELRRLLDGIVAPATRPATAAVDLLAPLPRTMVLPVVTSPPAGGGAGMSTLRSAASVIEEVAAVRGDTGARRKTRWIATAVSALVAVVVAGGLLFSRSSRDRAMPASAPTTAPAAAPAAAPSPAPEPEPTPPPPAPPAPAEEGTVVLTIESVPAGAEVVESRNGTVLGSTPFEARFRTRDTPARLSVRKGGFRPKSLVVDLDRDQRLSVPLEKRATPRPEKRPAAPAAPRPPAEDPNERRKL